MSTINTIPTSNAPFLDKTGLINTVWYRFLSTLSSFNYTGVTPIVSGGTGATTASSALSNLGGQPIDADLTALSALIGTGLVTRTAGATYSLRTVTGTANRLSVSNGDGVSGNPTLNIDTGYVGQTSITTLGTVTTGTWNATIVAVLYGGTGATTASGARSNLGLVIGTDVQAYDTTLTALASYNTNGIMTQTASDTFTGRTITGTSNRLSVTNGSGVSGNPTLDIDSNYVGQSSITTLGTIVTGTWAGTTVTVDHGGTGVASATAYAVLCGGTTSTGAYQSIASVGTSGHVLTSNGAAALPTFQAAVQAATQAEQETGSSTTTYVSPGRQQYHASSAKSWAKISYSGGSPVLDASYNVSSVVDSATGVAVVYFGVSFSSATYCHLSATPDDLSLIYSSTTGYPNAAYIIALTYDNLGAYADYPVAVVCYGDQ